MIKRNYKFEYFLIIFAYLTLIFGFYFNENSIGGADYDFSIISEAIIAFSDNLHLAYNNYASYKIAHFPYYYIILALVYKITKSFFLLKIFILHVSLLLPFIFYKVLKTSFRNIDEKYILILLCLFFVSPSFRSTAIWGLNDNIALIFFTASIFFFQKFNFAKNKRDKIYNIVILTLMLSISAYIRQYYAVFIIFYLIALFNKNDLKTYCVFLITNLILSLPAFFAVFGANNLSYGFILNFNSTAGTERIISLFTNYVLALTMFSLYLIPLFFVKKNMSSFIDYYLKRKILSIIFLLASLLIFYFFDYKSNWGGGLFFKLFKIFEINKFFWLIIFFTLLTTFFFIKDNIKYNLPIFVSIILVSSLQAIFQKYYDPLAIILILCLLRSDMTNNFFNDLKNNISYFMFYFIFLYFGSLFYYS